MIAVCTFMYNVFYNVPGPTNTMPNNFTCPCDDDANDDVVATSQGLL